MKTIHLIVLVLLSCTSFSCKKTSDAQSTVDAQIIINSVEVSKNDLVLNQVEGRWYYEGEPYNGYSLKYHSNDTLAERLGFYNGKREGIAKRWSQKDELQIESYYKQNRLDGSYKSWWENGVLASEAKYRNGKLSGVEKKWYPTGQLAKERQMVNGKEEGLQKAWLKNGTLYVNYESKNGRIFGMRRANSCYQLEDETVVQIK
ncbi:toxin-antitoxin system YwqK family antitoxin [Maribacter algarum]|uniref:Toxin-antitoxin system YwqK family antitoxin n=1 Tax=Maribacter algarum (ex Zhang et al. 2020) TaxID=2578118 RepID=A0A5S3PHP1_9FLAO|nr:toxin-antitoxin system YwqK family antitoxin [Maribacter algarum]TMM53712.1 toxin-antitoxin system YwqK family antitoxin [Maribacter algarum]